MTQPDPIWLTPPHRLTLAPNHVHLFLAPIAPPPIPLEDILSADEKEKIARLKIPEKRTESLISHLLVRQVLSLFLNTPPQQIIFTLNPHGKPCLQNSPLHFNLSHTKDFALLTVTQDQELGIDIEALNPNISHEDLAHRYFTPAENAALISLLKTDRLRAFYRCWTRKEALLKATGTGLSSGLNTFSVPLSPSPTPLAIPPWNLHDLPVPPTHIASLATQSANPILYYWHYTVGLKTTSTQ